MFHQHVNTVDKLLLIESDSYLYVNNNKKDLDQLTNSTEVTQARSNLIFISFNDLGGFSVM